MLLLWKKGHLAPDCPEQETKKKSDWYMYKAVSAYQSSDKAEAKEAEPSVDTKEAESKDSKNNAENRKVKWTGSLQGFQKSE